jgi:hypothetical protein
MPTTAGLQTYLSASLADSHQPCIPYDSQTNTGSTQHVSAIHVVDLSSLGVPALAWKSTITQGGRSITGGAIVIEADPTFVFLQFAGLRPLDDSSIEALARSAFTRAKV